MTHYLDHAATTPMHPAAIDAVTTQMATVGNPSSLHAAGRAARKVVEESRERIASALGARPSEVVFTSGGTEADNIAVRGTYAARTAADPARRRVLVPEGEHHAVLDTVEALVERDGATVTWLACDASGVVAPETVRAAIEENPDDVALASVMWANNEIGTIQPIAEIGAIAAEHGIPLHTDAVQAAGHVPVDFAASGATLMSVTGHKLGGPVGLGALLAQRDAAVLAQSFGGGQERQIRSGTVPVALIAGFAAAVAAAVEGQAEEAARIAGLRDDLITGALGLGLDIEVNGPWEAGDTTRRLPGNVSLFLPGTEGDSLLYLLDAAGIECSTGSACQAGVPQPSHVLLALGRSERDARSALRLSLGRTSTQDDVRAVLEALPAAVERSRRASGR